MDLRLFKFLFRGSRHGKLVYASVPKAGCSTVQLTMANEYARISGAKRLGSPHSARKGEFFVLFNDPARPALVDLLDQSTLFSVVRNPYSRLLSAYLDKIQNRTKECSYLLKTHGLSEDRSLSFADFVHIVAEEHADQMDQHWAPQETILAWDVFRYDRLGFHESFADDLLACLAQGGCPVESLDQFSRHGQSASSKLDDFYDEDLKRIVYRIYRKDFELFGYSQDITNLNPDRSASAASMHRPHRIAPVYEALVAAHDAMGRGRVRDAAESLKCWLVDAEARKIVSFDDYKFAGQVFLKTRRLAEAERMFNAALAGLPNNPIVLLGLARCAIKTGRRGVARQYACRVPVGTALQPKAAKLLSRLQGSQVAANGRVRPPRHSEMPS